VHDPAGPDHLGAEGEADGLVAQAHAQNGVVWVKNAG